MSQSSEIYAGAFEQVGDEPAITITLTREAITDMLDMLSDENVILSKPKWQEIINKIDDEGFVSDFIEQIVTFTYNQITE